MPDPSPLDLARAAIDVFLAHPQADGDETVAALMRRGIGEEEAWRLYLVVPSAFCKVALADRGISFPETYLAEDPETGERTQHRWEDSPLHRAATEASHERIDAGLTQQEMSAIAGRSAEYDAIRKLARGQDLSDIVLTESVLLGYRA